MRIVSVFLWIVFAAIILWFFAINLDQYVTLKLFTRVYEDVNLVTIVFISIFFGVIIGALLLSVQVLKTKSRLSAAQKENKKLLTELDNIRSIKLNDIQASGEIPEE
jgi:uncharacterized integral membrane protein